MPYVQCIWDLDDDPAGNVMHIERHHLTKDDVEGILREPAGEETSHSSGQPIAFGYIGSGERVAVVYEQIDDLHVYPITAYRVE
jgi:hypothetical protein